MIAGPDHRYVGLRALSTYQNLSTKLWSVLKKGFYRRNSRRQAMSYPSDVTDAEWDEIKDFFIPAHPGRPPKHDRRALYNAIRYVQRTGCQWRLLPTDFPPWPST